MESIKLLGYFLDNVHEAAYIIKANGRFKYVNKESCQMLGYTSDELLSMSVCNIDPDFPPNRWKKHWYRLKKQRSMILESIHKSKDNRIIPVEINANYFEYENEAYNLALVRDITERKRSGEKLHRLNRELRAISSCNQAVIRARDEQPLLDDICRIVCEEAGYRFAWIGYAEYSEVKSIRPIAWAGFDDSYLASITITCLDTEHEQGPSSMAISSGKSVYVQDLLSDSMAASWRDSAFQRGYRSCIALPLKDGDLMTFGVLNIYSSETNAFTPAEIRLLEELAADTAFGICALRTRLEREKSEEALRHERVLLNQIIEASPVGITKVNRDGFIVFANQQAEKVLGLTKKMIIERTYNASEWHITDYDGNPFPDEELPVRRVLSSGQPVYGIQHAIRKSDGETVYLSINGQPLRNEIGEIENVILTIEDITEQKRIAQERIENLHFFESIDKVNRAIQGADDLEHMMRDVLDVVLAVFAVDRVFLMYPCDPNAETWTVPVERVRSEYPGVNAFGIEMRMDVEVAETLRILLSCEGPVQFGPGTSNVLPAEVSKRFGFKSFMSMAIYTKVGKPWQFGIHQCSHQRKWTAGEMRLFQEIGRRLGDALSNFITYRDLQESEAKYRRLIDTASEGIIVLDPDARISFINARMAEMLGYSVKEVVGKPLTAFMFEEDIPDHQRRMETRRQGKREYYERRLRHTDGHVIWTIVSATPIFDKSFRFSGSFAMLTDITERKLAEDSMNEKKQFIDSLLRAIPVAVFYKDRAGKYLGCNDTFTDIMGITSEQIKGKTVQEIWPSDLAEKYHAMDLELMRTRQHQVYEFQVKAKDGRLHPVIYAKDVFLNKDGEVGGLVGAFLDITERKEAEEEVKEYRNRLEELVKARTAQLEAVNMDLEAFTYSVSHDLRAPLRAINGFSKILLEDYNNQLPKDGQQLITAILRNTNQMGQLIDDLLKLSRSSRQQLMMTSINMTTLAKTIWEEQQKLAQNRTIEVSISILPEAQGDYNLMRQVWENLISNAIKYSKYKEIARIEIGSYIHDKKTIYYIKDNGAGFDMAYKNKLFGVFQRLHSTEQFEGTGVGLAIVNRIIKKHGGDVWADAEIGEGATFYFTLK